MTFRTRLLLIFTVAVILSVTVVELLVSAGIEDRFERLESQRVGALVAQFRKEYDRSRQEIARAVNGIAASDTAVHIATQSDYSQYVAEAGDLAKAHGLDLLELVAADGTIISSAEWPARFGYKEAWLAERPDWNARGTFLKREELPDGVALALVAVGSVTAGDQTLLYVVGGKQLDNAFLSELVLPSGMRALLYRNLRPQFTPADLIDASGPAPDAAKLRPLIERVKGAKSEETELIGSGAGAETIHAIPLFGLDKDLLGVLLVASSRRDLVELEAFLLKLGAAVASGGIFLGIALSSVGHGAHYQAGAPFGRERGKGGGGRLGRDGGSGHRR